MNKNSTPAEQQATGDHIAQAAKNSTAIVGDVNVIGDGSTAIKAEEGAIVAVDGGVAGGQVAVGGDVHGDVTLGHRVTNIFRGTTDEQRNQRNRQAMLQLVKNFWVKGVLEQSLHGAAMIELGMEERAEAVERPWDMVLQTDREDRPLPSGTKIIDVFDEMGGSLLILGEPGSGKTTMLLELARDTIACAEKDLIQPIETLEKVVISGQ